MKFAILNGLYMHYEMFGYIIHFCKCYEHTLTIFSTSESHGWNIFYKQLFSETEWKSYELFKYEHNNYDYIFLTTDDDFTFADIIHTKKNVFCIDHYYQNRRPQIQLEYHLATRPFSIEYRKWALPCYPIIKTVEDKMYAIKDKQLLSNDIHIVIIGGGDYIMSSINRISSSYNIILHVISRDEPIIFFDFNKNFTVFTHSNISTIQMMNILTYSSYILCDITRHKQHIDGLSMSGSIPISFSTLNKLIISNKNNNYYKFNSVITFDTDSTSLIEISHITINELKNIQDERNRLIHDFYNIITPFLIKNQSSVEN
jgi:hypothetical protein